MRIDVSSSTELSFNTPSLKPRFRQALTRLDTPVAHFFCEPCLSFFPTAGFRGRSSTREHGELQVNFT